VLGLTDQKENNSRNNHESFVVTTTRSQSWRLQRIVHNFLGDCFNNLVTFFFFLYLIVVIFIVDGLRVNFLGIHHRRRKWRTRTSIDDQGRHDSVILSVIIQSTSLLAQFSQFNGRVQINTHWRSLFDMSYASHDRK